MDYRISTTEIASLDYNTEDWVEQVKKYAADPRVTSYNVHGDGHYGMTLLKALIENSTPELNLLDKAFFYLFDEPYTMLEQASETYYRKIDELIALADSYTEEELAEYGLTKADIEGVEVMITLTASINTIEGLRTYCARRATSTRSPCATGMRSTAKSLSRQEQRTRRHRLRHYLVVRLRAPV